MTGWTPEALDNLGAIGVLAATVLGHLIAYLRGWIIPGSHHRETVANRDKQIARAEQRGDKLADTLDTLSKAVEKQATKDEIAADLLAAIRRENTRGD